MDKAASLFRGGFFNAVIFCFRCKYISLTIHTPAQTVVYSGAGYAVVWTGDRQSLR